MRGSCIICGDLFIASEDISATPCGHTFHSICIIQWIERSKSCPKCRHKATNKSLLKLYFDASADIADVDPDTLQHQIDNQKFQIRLKETELKNLKESTSTLTTQNKNLRTEYKQLEGQVHDKETTILALKTQLQFMDRITKEAQKAKDEAKKLRDQLKFLQRVEMVVDGQSRDVDEILNSYCCEDSESIRQIAVVSSILKKELNKALDDKKKFRDEVNSCKRKMKESQKYQDIAAKRVNTLEAANSDLKENLQSLEKDNISLKKKVQALQASILSPSGDVRNSAIHRLINESPAPAALKRTNKVQDDDPYVTPEVIRKLARTESIVVTSDESHGDCGDVMISSDEENLCIDLTSPPISQHQKVKSRPMRIISSESETSSSHHHNIFAKPKKTTGLISRSSSSSSITGITSFSGDMVGYDGLGGHHKVDQFPKPIPVKLKKKRAVKITNKHGASSRVQTSALKNFFQNTFDD